MRFVVEQNPWTYMENVYLKNEAIPAAQRASIAAEARDLAREHYDRTCLNNTLAIEGGAETVRALRALGIPIGVVSNSRTEHLVPLVRRVLGPELGDIEIIGDAKKPAHEAPRAMLRRLGVDPQSYRDTWFVGDSMQKDVLAAFEIGLYPILFSPRHIPLIADLRARGFTGSVGFVEGHADLLRLINAAHGARLLP